jgi:hypothetical protein
VEPGELALDRDLVLRPETTDDLRALGRPRGALLSRNAERLELVRRVALAEAEIEAAVRDDVDERHVLGDAHGVLERHQQDERADADPLRHGGDGRGGRQQRRIVAVAGEVVLGQPDVVVAGGLGGTDLVEDRAVELRLRPPPRSGVAKVFHEAEAHREILLRPSSPGPARMSSA